MPKCQAGSTFKQCLIHFFFFYPSCTMFSWKCPLLPHVMSIGILRGIVRLADSSIGSKSGDSERTWKWNGVRVKSTLRMPCGHPRHSATCDEPQARRDNVHAVFSGPPFPHLHSRDNNHIYIWALLEGLNEDICAKCLEQCLELGKCQINGRYYFHFQNQAAFILPTNLKWKSGGNSDWLKSCTKPQPFQMGFH